MSIAAPPPPPSFSPTIAAPAEDAAKRAKIRATAETFEGQFLSIMLQQMFEGLETAPPFGGGPGETMFRSLMTEAMGKQIARNGGVGVADAVTREMLKMQGMN